MITTLFNDNVSNTGFQ